MSDTQWPTMPTPGSANVQDPSDGSRFTVLVEENQGSSDSLRWVGAPCGTIWPNRADARAAAVEFAHGHGPRHPMSEQSRSVYRISPDEYVTVVQGATMSFSFHTLVVEPVDRSSSF